MTTAFSGARRLPVFVGAACLAGLGGAAGVGVVAGLAVGAARSASCDVRQHEPLSLAELIEVKRRFERYRNDPAVGFEVTAAELAMLIEDSSGAPIFLDLQGDRVSGEIALPARGGGCWPIRFDGELLIDAGTAFFVPAQLAVGDVDLSRLMASRRIELLPADMPSSRVASFLRQTQHAEVHAGALQVELVAPASFRLDDQSE